MPASKVQQARTAERRAQAVLLFIDGVGWQEIADRLGYSDRGAACKDVSRALEKDRPEGRAIAMARYVEGLRLDRIQAALWSRAMTGDVQAVLAVLKVIDRRMRLYGLNAPSRSGSEPRELAEEIHRHLDELVDDAR